MLGNVPNTCKNNIRSAPAFSSLAVVSHRTHNVCTADRNLRGKGERNGVQRRIKVSFGRTMMQALELLCGRQKGTSQTKAMLNCEEIKAV